MDRLERIQRDFLRGIELSASGHALMVGAFNDLLRYVQPQATGLYPTFSAVTPKPEGS